MTGGPLDKIARREAPVSREGPRARPVPREVGEFLARVAALTIPERADLARLAVAPAAVPTTAVLAALPARDGRGRRLGRGRVEAYVLAAALAAYCGPATRSRDLGGTLATLRRAHPEGGAVVDAIATALFAAPRAELRARLVDAATGLAAFGIGVDGARLLLDLLRWERPGGFVQERWSRSYSSAMS